MKKLNRNWQYSGKDRFERHLMKHTNCKTKEPFIHFADILYEGIVIKCNCYPKVTLPSKKLLFITKLLK